MKSVGNSLNKSCLLAGISKSSYFHRPKYNALNERIRQKLRELAAKRPRFGSPRLTILLRKEFGGLNHKRIERLYRLEKLSLPRKRRKKRWKGRSIPMATPTKPMERWSMDFIHDSLKNGRRYRVLNIVDDFTRESIRSEVGSSLTGKRVVRVLSQLEELHEQLPKSIVVDNGTEFTSKAVLTWAQEKEVNLDFIEPGKPIQNAHIESFNGRLRDECLNMNWFKNVDEAKSIIEDWRTDYNQDRPHSALGYKSPYEFKRELTHEAVL
jgi:putative transposase